MKVISRYKLSGIENLHGISLDQTGRLAFVVGEENHSFAVIDLKTMKLLTVHQVGEVPNVLAFDPSLKNLYISPRFQEARRNLTLLASSICRTPTRCPSIRAHILSTFHWRT